jgi:hypothetical protein
LRHDKAEDQGLNNHCGKPHRKNGILTHEADRREVIGINHKMRQPLHSKRNRHEGKNG